MEVVVANAQWSWSINYLIHTHLHPAVFSHSYLQLCMCMIPVKLIHKDGQESLMLVFRKLPPTIRDTCSLSDLVRIRDTCRVSDLVIEPSTHRRQSKECRLAGGRVGGVCTESKFWKARRQTLGQRLSRVNGKFGTKFMNSNWEDF